MLDRPDWLTELELCRVDLLGVRGGSSHAAGYCAVVSASLGRADRWLLGADSHRLSQAIVNLLDKACPASLVASRRPIGHFRCRPKAAVQSL